MDCCACCIGDRWLKKEVIPQISNSIGSCKVCGSDLEILLDPSSLRNYFELLVNAYRPSPEGKTLVEWFKSDWSMFPHLDNANAAMLLADILDDGQIVRDLFSPARLGGSRGLFDWQQFKQELMHKNRFFPETKIDTERLRQLLSQLIVSADDYQTAWFRARIQKDETQLPLGQMGAPPEKLASAGRANPSGIPYLYLASNATTAVSETRPHTGQFVSVAAINVHSDLKFIDLRNPRVTVSPFILGDEDEISLLREDLDLLMQLGRELTRPVLPHSAAIEYIPSQFLCEFIKMCGYHGVIYSSSVGDGMNLALFYPDLSRMYSVERHFVDSVSVQISCV